jgi:ABC-type transport system involved in multi-copper enzyme maturation permease subunit
MTNPVMIFEGSAVARPGAALALRQTSGLFVDALRRLRSAKLFWIALILSALVAGACGYIGINPAGLSFPGFGTWENAVWNSENLPPAAFYKQIFLTLGTNLWLAYAATLLAIISTASLVPSLIDEGSVDLYVTRPLGRTRLFLTRYLTGLLFVALQALCFSLTAMAVFWFRADAFLPGLLWAVPFVTLFFSFLYCVGALTGLLTGSGVTSILVTLLVWMFIWAADWTEFTVLLIREQQEAQVEVAERALERAQSVQQTMASAGTTAQAMTQDNVDQARADLAAAQSTLNTLTTVHNVAMAIKAPLPKTGETIGELNQKLSDATELAQLEAAMEADEQERIERMANRMDVEGEERNDFIASQRASNRGSEAAIEAYYSRPWWWTYGSSLGFQAIILAICAWIFARRDL